MISTCRKTPKDKRFSPISSLPQFRDESSPSACGEPVAACPHASGTDQYMHCVYLHIHAIALKFSAHILKVGGIQQWLLMASAQPGQPSPGHTSQGNLPKKANPPCNLMGKTRPDINGIRKNIFLYTAFTLES